VGHSLKKKEADEGRREGSAFEGPETDGLGRIQFVFVTARGCQYSHFGNLNNVSFKPWVLPQLLGNVDKAFGQTHRTSSQYVCEQRVSLSVRRYLECPSIVDRRPSENTTTANEILIPRSWTILHRDFVVGPAAQHGSVGHEAMIIIALAAFGYSLGLIGCLWTQIVPQGCSSARVIRDFSFADETVVGAERKFIEPTEFCEHPSAFKFQVEGGTR